MTGSKTFTILSLLFFLAALFACGPAKKPQTEPPVAKQPSIEELRQPVAKDLTIYKALHVIKTMGRFTQKYMKYEQYQKQTQGLDSATLVPDWFYDSYVLDMNENDYWANVTFGTAKRAIKRDPRIEKIMAQLPDQSITVKLKTPSGKTYLLTDAEADGILDYVQDTRKKPSKNIDIQLLDRMQKKYTWIISLIKKYYKK